MNDEVALELRDLTKDFALGLRGVRVRAVDHLSLQIKARQIYGLIGPNGSGKSTTIKLALGLLAPTAGECRIFGLSSASIAARRQVGYLPESPHFYRHLTGRELVQFYGRMCGLEHAAVVTITQEVLATVGLTGAADRRIGTYSKGMLQRVGLAQALVHDPRLLILDEPTAGVDPVGAMEIANLLVQLKTRGKTILITSHLLAQMEVICDRVAILAHGRLVAEGTMDELAGREDRQALIVNRLTESQLAELRTWLELRGSKLDSVEQPRTRLDQVFLRSVASGGDSRSRR